MGMEIFLCWNALSSVACKGRSTQRFYRTATRLGLSQVVMAGLVPAIHV